jgi:hypothetical protein
MSRFASWRKNSNLSHLAGCLLSDYGSGANEACAACRLLPGHLPLRWNHMDGPLDTF